MPLSCHPLPTSGRGGKNSVKVPVVDICKIHRAKNLSTNMVMVNWSIQKKLDPRFSLFCLNWQWHSVVLNKMVCKNRLKMGKFGAASTGTPCI